MTIEGVISWKAVEVAVSSSKDFEVFEARLFEKGRSAHVVSSFGSSLFPPDPEKHITISRLHPPSASVFFQEMGFRTSFCQLDPPVTETVTRAERVEAKFGRHGLIHLGLVVDLKVDGDRDIQKDVHQLTERAIQVGESLEGMHVNKEALREFENLRLSECGSSFAALSNPPRLVLYADSHSKGFRLGLSCGLPDGVLSGFEGNRRTNPRVLKSQSEKGEKRQTEGEAGGKDTIVPLQPISGYLFFSG
uniref:Uncharacterized protein n=1 Tax=Chromera velia CCMP2878 TaxID=1169474 RepID=A0A0G4G2F4_9ALVE|eukprot:Cvel_19964.t1-p1 / transcript=Cvel_19964.t1 / gene=Cvel_19964 / organism=Chromera_velia_CCMP2878 / gene_product=hypothetical protein / transcript_product=hypothetical protein / location=Cvel_scaffold1757:36967-38302(+) / protein_length=247 / sequence_SO=supercontig / SO=protein_coding / is_pseudo=false